MHLDRYSYDSALKALDRALSTIRSLGTFIGHLIIMS